MASLRARLLERALRGGIGALRRYRERRLGVGPITADIAAEVFEEGALEVREVMERVTALSRTAFGVRERQLAATPVPTWWLEPDRPTDRRTVLYLHGGAYVAGSHATHRALASAIARMAAADVVLPEYRLAPEHRFPAPVEDALATLRWLIEVRGIPADHVVAAGDSAGGGLAVATALAARDVGLPRLAGLALLSPWVDLTGSGESITANNGIDPWLDGPLVAVGGSAYAPEDPTHPYASPLFADLAGLPPMLVHVGTHEVLLDDSRRLVERAREAGVPASLGTFDGMWHVFQAFPGLPETWASLREIAGFVRRAIDEPASIRR